MKKIYKLRKQDWMWHFSDKIKKKVIEQINTCLNDPNASYSEKNRASQNLITINKQNMDACDDAVPDSNITIIIKEEGDGNHLESPEVRPVAEGNSPEPSQE